MKNFIKENWFKLSLLLVLIVLLNLLSEGININVNHYGSIKSNYSDIDGATIYNQ